MLSGAKLNQLIYNFYDEQTNLASWNSQIQSWFFSTKGQNTTKEGDPRYTTEKKWTVIFFFYFRKQLHFSVKPTRGYKSQQQKEKKCDHSNTCDLSTLR